MVGSMFLKQMYSFGDGAFVLRWIENTFGNTSAVRFIFVVK